MLHPVNGISLFPVPWLPPRCSLAFRAQVQRPLLAVLGGSVPLEIPWFGSLQLYFPFFYSALCPSSGLKYIHQFPIFLARELMTVSVLTEPSPPALTPGRVWWDEESQLQLLGALRESGGLDSLCFTPEVGIEDPVRPGGGDSIPCPIPSFPPCRCCVPPEPLNLFLSSASS